VLRLARKTNVYAHFQEYIQIAKILLACSHVKMARNVLQIIVVQTYVFAIILPALQLNVKNVVRACAQTLEVKQHACVLMDLIINQNVAYVIE